MDLFWSQICEDYQWKKTSMAQEKAFHCLRVAVVGELVMTMNISVAVVANVSVEHCSDARKEAEVCLDLHTMKAVGCPGSHAMEVLGCSDV